MSGVRVTGVLLLHGMCVPGFVGVLVCTACTKGYTWQTCATFLKVFSEKHVDVDAVGVVAGQYLVCPLPYVHVAVVAV